MIYRYSSNQWLSRHIPEKNFAGQVIRGRAISSTFDTFIGADYHLRWTF